MQDEHRAQVSQVVTRAIAGRSQDDVGDVAAAVTDALHEAGLLYEPQRIEPLAHPKVANEGELGNFATSAYDSLSRAHSKVRGIVTLLQADCEPDDPTPRAVALALSSIVDLTAAVVYSLTDVALSMEERNAERGR